MSHTPKKSSFQEFIELLRFSTATLFAGIVSASTMMQYPLSALLFGIAGVINFILSIKFDQDADRSERFIALLGLTLALAAIIYVLINILHQSVLRN